MYRHTQPASLFLIALLIVAFIAILYVWTGVREGGIPMESDANRAVTLIVIALTSFLMLLMLAFFYNLTVSDDGDALQLKYGIGMISKRIFYREVQFVETVRNPWWWGWGIKRIPGGWMWNISGFDAVELNFKDGRKFRVGTNEPDVLVEVIRGKIEPTT